MPATRELFESWGYSETRIIKCAISLRRLLVACEDREDKINADRDTIRQLMLGVHETGKELNMREVEEAVECINYLMDMK